MVEASEEEKEEVMEWRARHRGMAIVLKAWGRGSQDLAAMALGGRRPKFELGVDEDGMCMCCKSKGHVVMMRTHFGMGAFEWTHGVDIDWRATCCGKHVDLCDEKYCVPNGYHEDGCGVVPVCTRCRVCVCRVCIDRRKKQLDGW